jgi:hypothetical protein
VAGERTRAWAVMLHCAMRASDPAADAGGDEAGAGAARAALRRDALRDVLEAVVPRLTREAPENRYAFLAQLQSCAQAVAKLLLAPGTPLPQLAAATAAQRGLWLALLDDTLAVLAGGDGQCESQESLSCLEAVAKQFARR